MVKRIFKLFIPPPRWRLPVILALGVLTGLLLVIFHISNAVSYMSNDPVACMNCHVMTPQFATWQKSSHARKNKVTSKKKTTEKWWAAFLHM